MKSTNHALIFLLIFWITACESKRTLLRTDPITTITFGSCNRQDAPQPLWKPILKENPDLWIWMGDNIYGDSHHMDTLRAKYARQKANPEYLQLVQSASIIGIWDDHDYGINDGGKYFCTIFPRPLGVSYP